MSTFKKIIILTIISGVILSLVSISGDCFAQAKKRLAVVDFENKTPDYWWGERLGRAASDMLVNSLVKTNKFTMIEREKLQAILNEQGLAKSGAVTTQTAAKVGQLLGIELIITGAVSEFGRTEKGAGFGGFGGTRTVTARCAVDARLVDVNSGEILMGESATSTETFTNVTVLGFGGGVKWDETMATKTMRGAIETLTAKIAERAEKTKTGPWQARIAKVEGSKVWLNAGTNQGIKEGDTFDIISTGEEIKDPTTGQSLGAEEKKVGNIVIIESKDRFSIGQIKTGSGFKVNDIVRKP